MTTDQRRVFVTTRRSTRGAAVLALSCLWGAGCTASIGDAGPPGAGPGTSSGAGVTGTGTGVTTGTGVGTGGGVSTGTGTGGVDPTGPAALLGLPASPVHATSLHKLTAWEFANSMQDLLGSGVPLAPVEADTLIGGFATVGGSSVSISPAGVGQYATIVGNATAYAFADATRAASVLSCVPKATTD